VNKGRPCDSEPLRIAAACPTRHGIRRRGVEAVVTKNITLGGSGAAVISFLECKMTKVTSPKKSWAHMVNHVYPIPYVPGGYGERVGTSAGLYTALVHSILSFFSVFALERSRYR